MESTNRRDVWSRYWATGMPHSCGGSYEGRYSGAIASFWREAFANLEPGARVLDIATGNAPLPRLLLDLTTDRSITCDAVDMAQVQPPWLQELTADQRSRLRLHSGVIAESLPFADRTFSFVISQYGIEYADLSRAVPELLRVLTSNGRIRMLIHHAGSRPVQLAADEIEHIDWLLAPEGFLDLAAAMIVPMSRAATPAGRAALAGDAAANALRGRFNAVQRAISDRVQTSDCPDVLQEWREAVARLFGVAMASGPQHAAQMLADARATLMDARLRLHELRQHALNEPAIADLCQRLENGGLSMTHGPLSDAGHLMGWAIQGCPHA